MAMKRRLLARQLEEARQGRRDHQQLDHRLRLLAPPQVEDQAEPAVGDERERMRRVDRLRRQHRQDLLAEMVGQPGALGVGQILLAERPRAPRSASASRSTIHSACCATTSASASLGDRVELLRRGHAVGAQILDPLQLMPLEAGDADHEEFVEVGAGDRQEAKPLEQRMGRVGRLLQHAPVEGEPAQLAVEQPRRRCRPDRPRVHAAPRASMMPPSPSARRMVGRVSRARSAMAKRSIASTTRSAIK